MHPVAVRGMQQRRKRARRLGGVTSLECVRCEVLNRVKDERKLRTYGFVGVELSAEDADVLFVLLAYFEKQGLDVVEVQANEQRYKRKTDEGRTVALIQVTIPGEVHTVVPFSQPSSAAR